MLRLSATDSALSAADEVTVTVSPATGGGATTFETSIAVGSDDAEQRATGGVDLDSSDLELVTDGTNVQRVGLRFTGVQIPAGATITRAWVQFQTDEVSTDTATLTVRGEAADNTPTYVGTNSNLSNRALTSASVAWSPPPGTPSTPGPQPSRRPTSPRSSRRSSADPAGSRATPWRSRSPGRTAYGRGVRRHLRSPAPHRVANLRTAPPACHPTDVLRADRLPPNT